MDYASLPAREIERLSRNVAPGAWAVERQRPLSTLLGSCVAVCMFDLHARVGGINHFMLPNMQRSADSEVDSLLSGDYAMEALLNALLAQGARKARIQAKAFGGGTIIETSGQSLAIGQRNARFARDWLQREGIPIVASDFLGPWSRKVLFVPSNGDAWCKRIVTSHATAEVIAREERAYAATLAAAPSSSSGNTASAPLASASARPLNIRFARQNNSRTSPPLTGAARSNDISSTMQTAEATIKGRRPIRSASAPEGTSAATMTIAHTKLSSVYCVAESPRSRNSTANTG